MDLSFHKKAFLYGKSLSFILFILAFGGIVVAAPQYLDLLGLILRYYVCAFLLIRFNPIFEIKTRDHDFERKVAFSAGVFLFLTTTMTTLAQYRIDLPDFVPHTHPRSIRLPL